jgi:transcriptional regulator with XRE-family HTH domain
VHKTQERNDLRQIREERGLTLDQLGVLAGVDASTISRAERGLQGLRPETVVRLSRALKVKTGRISP